MKPTDAMTMTDPSRRRFLRGAAAAGLGGAALGPWGTLQALAQTAQGADYKALICLFMYGGNDGNNLLVPRATPLWQTYNSVRGHLALPRDSLQPLTLSYRGAAGNTDFGLHGAFAGLAGLVNSGRAAVLANIGTLMAPTTLAQWEARSVPLPVNLFSHSDQSAQWQTDVLDSAGRSGWGGRSIEQVIGDQDPNRGYACISVSGNTLWVTGTHAAAPAPYRLSPNGRFGFDFFTHGGSDPVSRAMDDMLQPWSSAAAAARPFEATWLRTLGRSINAQAVLAGALDGQPAPAAFRAATLDTDLGRQLAMIARLIAVAPTLGLRRQCFFCSIGGFDTHGGDQLDQQAANFTAIDQAVTDFSAAMQALNRSDQVTLFTASDFGRTFESNGQGTDHGWGSHHLVVGGAVKGAQLLGRFPNHNLADPNNADDVGSGNWLPSTSIDQLGRALATWFGAGAAVPAIFPRAALFPEALDLMRV